MLVSVGSPTSPLDNISPPLGILYLAAWIRDKMDCELRVENSGEERWSAQDIVRRVVDYAPDVLALSTLTPSAFLLPIITRGVRKALPKTLQVIGGAHATATGRPVLATSEADSVVIGEGEISFEAVIRHHLDCSEPSDVPGLIWRDAKGEIRENPGNAPIISDLDTLPFPAYDLIDLSRYQNRLRMTSFMPNRRYMSLFSSRGCPYGCIFCHSVFGRRFRAQSPERMVAELEYFSRTFEVDEFEYLDDVFNLNAERVVAFSDLVRQRGLKVRLAFPNALRGDIITEEVAEALVSAGTYYTALALESGSPRIQKLIGKNLDLPKFLNGVKMMSRRRVFTYGFAIMGFPTETREEMEMTARVAYHSDLHVVSFFKATPFPGTRMRELAMESCPDQVEQVRFDDMEYVGLPANVSAESGKVLFACQREAYLRFYLRPSRMMRILRDHPYPWYLPKCGLSFISHLRGRRFGPGSACEKTI
jgi:radical SAM superfamily enzyme YgiQ (UPF0313 family)